jgi:hypothetical protein
MAVLAKLGGAPGLPSKLATSGALSRSPFLSYLPPSELTLTPSPPVLCPPGLIPLCWTKCCLPSELDLSACLPRLAAEIVLWPYVQHSKSEKAGRKVMKCGTKFMPPEAVQVPPSQIPPTGNARRRKVRTTLRQDATSDVKNQWRFNVFALSTISGDVNPYSYRKTDDVITHAVTCH